MMACQLLYSFAGIGLPAIRYENAITKHMGVGTRFNRRASGMGGPAKRRSAIGGRGNAGHRFNAAQELSGKPPEPQPIAVAL
jgi:hypothetical protein